jgi:isocitrate lyase
VKHQAFVGTGYFDDVAQVIAGGASSTTALHGSTEQEQFHPCARVECENRIAPESLGTIVSGHD